jgi:ribosomal protein S18 acetylase RimI-like enzyme
LVAPAVLTPDGRRAEAAMIGIVAYEPKMLVPLVDMWRASFEFGVGIVDPHPIEGQREHFVRRVLPECEVSVAMRDGELVGFVASNRESVSQLYVRVGCHRQGVGSQLLELAKTRSGGSLWLYTFARNAVARRFYERHGFVDAGHGFENMWQLEDVRYEWRRDAA